MDGSSTYVLLAAALAVVLHTAFNFRKVNLRWIPTVGGPSDVLLSYIGALRCFTNMESYLSEGYARFKGKCFKIAEMDHWTVIVSGPELVDEIRHMPDDVMSFVDFSRTTFQIQYTLGKEISDDDYHVGLVYTKLNKNLASVFPIVHDEVAQAYRDSLPESVEGWTSVTALDFFMNIVCRASNRVFVGQPLCRDPDFLKLNIQMTLDIGLDSVLINRFPTFLQPIAGPLISKLSKSTAKGIKHLQPLIEDRRRLMREHGTNYPNKPNDMMSWLLDAAEERESRNTMEDLMHRIFGLNFSAIHTTANTMTHAVFHLAGNPQFAEPMRKEVEEAIASEGWTKGAVTKMHRIDSFIKESTRFSTFNATSMNRVAYQDCTLSDGTFIPKGTFIGAPTVATHRDGGNYAEPDTFDPWRFAGLDKNDGGKSQFVTTTTEFIPFGHGRHACPGRFFASNELKLMLAYLVHNYDVQLEGGSRKRPDDICFSVWRLPSSTAKICLRSRST